MALALFYDNFSLHPGRIVSSYAPSATPNSKCMAQFWIAIFFILLAIAQLYQSIKDINLPFPVYLVLGMVLAVAGNSQHKFSFMPTQQVTLQEIKVPDLALNAQTSPLLTTTADRDLAPAQPDPIKPKQPRTRKAAPKSPLLTATDNNRDLAPAPLDLEPKQKRTRKAAVKSKPV